MCRKGEVVLSQRKVQNQKQVHRMEMEVLSGWRVKYAIEQNHGVVLVLCYLLPGE